MNPPNAENAAPYKIVIKYFIAGIISFLLLNLLLILNYDAVSGHHFQPKILALTHIATLGWITMVIFGALYQLIPVVLEVKLFSGIIAEVQFWIYSAGAAGLIYCFWFFELTDLIIWSAVVLNAAMYLFVFNVIMTMKTVKKWNLTGYFLAAAIFYLVITAVAGLMMAVNLVYPYVKANHLQYLNLHANIAFGGWVSMVVMGVSLKLLPMFTLSHGRNTLPAKLAFWFINTGLLGISTVMHYEETTIWFYIFSALTAAGVVSFLIQIYIIYSRRVRKKSDTGILSTYAAYWMMGAAAGLGTFFAFAEYLHIANITLIYGIVIVFGYLSLLITGQMYKILPFMVWYHKYSKKAGKEKVPVLKEMYNEKWAGTGFYLMLTAVILIVVSLSLSSSPLLLTAFLLMFSGSSIFAVNMYTIFRR